MKVTKVDQVAGGTAAVAVAIDLATSIQKNCLVTASGNVDVSQILSIMLLRISNLTTRLNKETHNDS